MKVKEIFALFIGAAIFFAGCFSPYLYGDDHVIRERTLSYRGHTSPKEIYEVWIGENKAYQKSGSFITIFRTDLGKKWTLSPKFNKYLEEPLNIPAVTTKNKKRMQEIGWRYKPEYDWIVKETKKNQKITDKECRYIVLQGDADYAEEVHELWITEDVPIDIKRYYEMYLKYTLDKNELNLYKVLPELKNSFPIRNIRTSEAAIAPTMISEYKAVKIETAAPPPGLYDIPTGFQRADSKAGLVRSE